MNYLEEEYSIGDVSETPNGATPQDSWSAHRPNSTFLGYDTLFESVSRRRVSYDERSEQDESPRKRPKRNSKPTLASFDPPPSSLALLCYQNFKNVMDHVSSVYATDTLVKSIPEYQSIVGQLQATAAEKSFVDAFLRHLGHDLEDFTLQQVSQSLEEYSQKIPQPPHKRTAATAVAAVAHQVKAQQAKERGFSASLSAQAIQALSAALNQLPSLNQITSGALACQDPGVASTLTSLDQKLASFGEPGFLANLLKQVGYEDGLLLSDFVTWWKTMCDSLLEQQRASQGRMTTDMGSIQSSTQSFSNSDTLRAPSGSKSDEVEENIMLDVQPEIQIGLWKLLARVREVVRVEGVSNLEARQRSARNKLGDYVGQLIKSIDGGDEGVITNIVNQSGLKSSRPLTEIGEKLALLIAKHIPVQYAFMRKSLMSIYLFLCEMKTNNPGLDSKKMDNMVQGQIAYQHEFLRQRNLDQCFAVAVNWNKCHVSQAFFTLQDLPEEENSVNVDALCQDLMDFITVDPGIADAAPGVDNSIIALELGVPKVENIFMVSDAMILVEYLRRQWTRYRNLFGDGIRWITFCRVMGSSSSSENRFAKPLRRSAALIGQHAEIQEIYRRPYTIEMRELKDKMDRIDLEDSDSWPSDKTLEAVDQLKSWRIRNISIVELVTKLSDCCDCLRATSLSPHRQNELLSVFVSGLKTQIDPTQDGEVLNMFEDYVTRRFHFDYTKSQFDSGWNLSMFSASLQYMVNFLTTQGSSPSSSSGNSRDGSGGDSSGRLPSSTALATGSSNSGSEKRSLRSR